MGFTPGLAGPPTRSLTMKLVKHVEGQVEVLLIVKDYGEGEKRGFLPDKH